MIEATPVRVMDFEYRGIKEYSAATLWRLSETWTDGLYSCDHFITCPYGLPTAGDAIKLRVARCDADGVPASAAYGYYSSLEQAGERLGIIFLGIGQRKKRQLIHYPLY